MVAMAIQIQDLKRQVYLAKGELSRVPEKIRIQMALDEKELEYQYGTMDAEDQLYQNGMFNIDGRLFRQEPDWHPGELEEYHAALMFD